MWYLDTLQNNLSDRDRTRLMAIFEPVVVGVQPEDSRRGLCVLSDGEIRHYGVTEKKDAWDPGRPMYLSSRNCGLDWRYHDLQEDISFVDAAGHMILRKRLALTGASRSPWSGRYITVAACRQKKCAGTWALISEKGSDDCSPRMVKISDDIFEGAFHPVAMLSRKRWLCTAHLQKEDTYTPVVLISDDDGESWKIVTLRSAPKHQPVWPHLGVRWQNDSAEPHLAELPDGRLMLLARTSLDNFYVHYSADGGETWTDGSPSRFYGTLTTPFLLRLSDGRVLTFWNNTRPLAEPNHIMTYPPVEQVVIEGSAEDVFTNRDACHVAITSDGENWTGFRELLLNECRNDADFRVTGGGKSSGDKSIHQFQAIELPYNKVLVAVGQHEICRRMVIFDVDWLYRKERLEDFKMGLKNVTTHLYVKSLSGCLISRHSVGHCAWNRTNGALLMPDPDNTGGEAVQICRVHDERLVSEKQGMVWNFPMMRRGTIRMQLRIVRSGIKINLCDHWMNAGDEHVDLWSRFSFILDTRVLPQDVWQEVCIKFDTNAGAARVFNGSEKLLSVHMRLDGTDGLSYLHLQTIAENEDFQGTYVRRLEVSGE